MMEKQAIVDHLNTDYGIEAARLTLLPLGADMNASVYQAKARNGASYFIKIKSGHQYEISAAISALLQASGIEQIIPPIKTVHGELTKRIDDFTLIAYPFIEGQDGFCRHLTDDQWVVLGKALRQVHAFGVPPSIQDQMRKETYLPKWREAVRLLDARLDEPSIDDETAVKLQIFMKEHRAIIRRLVDRAEFLSQKIQEKPPAFVLCHSDIHGGNVLIGKDGAIYIVDWDEPIMAPKERDLMFIGGGVANVWNNPHEEELFYTGYGKTNMNTIALAYYRHERIIEDIAVYGEALLMKAGGKNRAEWYKQFTDMFAPRGVIDIAFKTDEG